MPRVPRKEKERPEKNHDEADDFYSAEEAMQAAEGEGMRVDFSELKEVVEKLLEDEKIRQDAEQLLQSLNLDDLLKKIMSGDPAQIEEVVRSIKEYYEPLIASVRPAMNALPSMMAIPAHECATVIATLLALRNNVLEEDVLNNERLRTVALRAKHCASSLRAYLNEKFTRDEAFALVLAETSKGSVVLNHCASVVKECAKLPKIVGVGTSKKSRKKS